VNGSQRMLWPVAAASVVAGFVITAPWRIGTADIGRVSASLVAGYAIIALAVATRPRAALTALDADGEASALTLCLFAMGVFLFLLRLTTSHFFALDVNAWDFSVYYDRPLYRTVHGRFLFSDVLGTSTLAAHADFIVLLFAPLYVLRPSPYWLVAAHAVILTAGVVAAYAALRTIIDDDVGALLLASAFLLNRYSAKTVQYGFHHEVFYPVALFSIIAGFRARRNALLICATIGAVLIKQDAFLPVSGVAVAFMIFSTRRRTAFAILLVAILAFCLDYLVVMPHFAGTRNPWYGSYWSAWASTPARASLQMATHPLRVAECVSTSGTVRLIATLLLSPLIGFEWLAAAAPALIVYSTASLEKLRQFDLYYSMPVLPLLFCAAGAGVTRAAGFVEFPFRRRVKRLACCAVLLAASLSGAGYVIPRNRPERDQVGLFVSRVPKSVPIRIQSSLYPHAGYEDRLLLVVDASIVVGCAYLIDVESNAYPLSANQLERLAHALRRSGRYTHVRDGALEMFIPLN
jgi:uncharacterized membrane protein